MHRGPLQRVPALKGVPPTPNLPGVGGLYRERLTWGRVCSLGALTWCLPVKVCDQRVSICSWGLHRRGCWRAQSSRCLLIGLGEPVMPVHSGCRHALRCHVQCCLTSVSAHRGRRAQGGRASRRCLQAGGCPRAVSLALGRRAAHSSICREERGLPTEGPARRSDWG